MEGQGSAPSQRPAGETQADQEHAIRTVAGSALHSLQNHDAQLATHSKHDVPQLQWHCSSPAIS